jgi:hypothetical protein
VHHTQFPRIALARGEARLKVCYRARAALVVSVNSAAAHGESRTAVLVCRYLASQKSKIAAVAISGERETLCRGITGSTTLCAGHFGPLAKLGILSYCAFTCPPPFLLRHVCPFVPSIEAILKVFLLLCHVSTCRRLF